jgi:hypothetical protein
MLKKITFIIPSVLILYLFTGCTSAQKLFYSYKIDNYSTDTSKILLSTSRVISFNDYVFEFKMRENNFLEFEQNIEENRTLLKNSSTRYDTVGVYLLTNDQRYFEFDTFAVSSKLVNKGHIWEKEEGVKFNPLKMDTTGKGSVVPLNLTLPKDTVINNVSCYYAEIIRSKPTDKIGTKYFLVKNKQFNSLLKLQGLKWVTEDYCIIGLEQYLYDGRERYIQEPANLRPLTTAERKICESLIQKAGLPLPK